jgi:hypothetical protein
MVKKFCLIPIIMFFFISIMGCGSSDDSPLQVTRKEMTQLPDEGKITVEGELKNVGTEPKLVYLFVSLYGDMGMVKDSKKKLLNDGEPLKPGETLEFTTDFPYQEEVKTFNVKPDAKDPDPSDDTAQ